MFIVGFCFYVVVYNEEYRKFIIGYMLCYKVKFGIIGWV